MRHYEIMLLIHPDRSDQVSSMVKRYTQLISSSRGSVHRVEDLGRRSLAYPISKLNKACYVLLNVECPIETEQALKSSVAFDETVLRCLSIRKEASIKEPSILNTDALKDLTQDDSKSTRSSEKADDNITKLRYRSSPKIKDADIDYKNVNFLANYLTDTKKITRRRVVGGNAKQQHKLSQAIKRARFVGLLAHCDKYSQPEIN